MRFVLLGLGLAMAAQCAQAADKPLFGPPEAWVKSAPAYKSAQPTDAAAVKLLLQDQQFNFSAAADSNFQETRMLIQNAQGLGAVGTLVIPWNPETDTVTIHSLRIYRGDQVIDVLAKQSFTVVRRETNLEMAMLDGWLTAVIQPEDLRVGDVLELAFTITGKDPVMKGKSETIASGLSGAAVGHLLLRGVWEQPKSLRWRATEGLDGVKLDRTGATSVVEFDADDVQPLHPPDGAPSRFYNYRQLEFSEFRSWTEVADLVRPLYAKAGALAPDSPLKTEIAKIKAATSDPKGQAEAALALVQSQVRYVFLGMNDGGLVPADADATWSRRFGDCKAKTVLLLALAEWPRDFRPTRPGQHPAWRRS